MNHEGQASNGFQSDEGRMGRTFYTTGDVYSEEDETFTVRADNASSAGSARVPVKSKLKMTTVPAQSGPE